MDSSASHFAHQLWADQDSRGELHRGGSVNMRDERVHLRSITVFADLLKKREELASLLGYQSSGIDR
jgi:hypothetical protein